MLADTTAPLADIITKTSINDVTRLIMFLVIYNTSSSIFFTIFCLILALLRVQISLNLWYSTTEVSDETPPISDNVNLILIHKNIPLPSKNILAIYNILSFAVYVNILLIIL